MVPFWGGQNGENTRKQSVFGNSPAPKGGHFWSPLGTNLFRNPIRINSKVLRTWVEPQLGCAASLPQLPRPGAALENVIGKNLIERTFIKIFMKILRAAWELKQFYPEFQIRWFLGGQKAYFCSEKAWILSVFGVKKLQKPLFSLCFWAKAVILGDFGTLDKLFMKILIKVFRAQMAQS